LNIYVGNLPADATQQSVQELFAPYGAVDLVTLISDRVTGQPRGFGFVKMHDEAAATRALDALNGGQLGGRQLTVSVAKSQDRR